jgi:CTP synthase (UTP-ammonia lyase)
VTWTPTTGTPSATAPAGCLDLLAANGMRFTGVDPDRAVEVAELPRFPLYMATLFQPELSSWPRAHPMIAVAARAVAAHARDRVATAAAMPPG